jgi:guanylate kinase
LGEDALALFIKVSNIEVLKERLKKRATDSYQSIEMRLSKAKFEMGFESKFDLSIENENLEQAIKKTYMAIKQFIYEG